MKQLSYPAFRLFAVCIIVFQCAGCGAYRPAILPETGAPKSENDHLERVSEGVDVRIELKTGEIVTGEVSTVSSEKVALRRLGNFGLEQNEYRWNEIKIIEVYKPAILKSIVTVTTGLFVSYVALMFYGLSQMGD